MPPSLMAAIISAAISMPSLAGRPLTPLALPSSAAAARRSIIPWGTAMPGTFSFINRAIPAAFRGMIPAIMGTSMPAALTASINRRRSSRSNTPWVWMYRAPASTFWRSLLICKILGSYTGVTAAPLKKRGAPPARGFPPQSAPLSSISESIRRMPTESRSYTGLDWRQSPTTGWSPVRASMVSMPKEAAERTSPIRAIRFRSRPVICKMGSAPARFRWTHRPREEAFRQADCMSVTLMPWTRSLIRAAASSCSVKSNPLGGAISAVTAKRPASRALCNTLMLFSPSN